MWVRKIINIIKLFIRSPSPLAPLNTSKSKFVYQYQVNLHAQVESYRHERNSLNNFVGEQLFFVVISVVPQNSFPLLAVRRELLLCNDDNSGFRHALLSWRALSRRSLKPCFNCHIKLDIGAHDMIYCAYSSDSDFFIQPSLNRLKAFSPYIPLEENLSKHTDGIITSTS